MRIVYNPNSRYEAGRWEVREGKKMLGARQTRQGAETFMETVAQIRAEMGQLSERDQGNLLKEKADA